MQRAARPDALAIALLLLAACQGTATVPTSVDDAEPPPDEPTGGGRGGGNAPDAASSARDAAFAPEPDAAWPDAAIADAIAADGPGEGSVPAGSWARGVKVGLVEVAQSPFIKLGDGATVVPPGMRNAELIEGRPFYARLHVRTDAGFMARPLRAVLTIEQSSGERRDFEDSKTIAIASDPERLESTFNFLVPAEVVKPGARLEAAVHEAGAAAGPEPAARPRFPADGSLDLGVKAGRMVLDVVLVLVTGPSGPLDASPARRKRVEDHLYDVYPVQTVRVRWRDPVRVTQKQSTDSLFGILRDARIADMAKPFEYYHLLMAAEDASATLWGIATRVSSGGMNAGSSRVGLTLVQKHQVDTRLDTISHEIGHNHGRSHAPNCGAQSTDAAFPYPMGAVGTNGWSLRDMEFKSNGPNKELMGYCSPTWISDYTWRGFEDRVRIVSAYAEPVGAMPFAERSLQGFVSSTGSANWGVVPGALAGDAPRAPGQRALVVLAGGGQVEAPVAVQTLSDDLTRQIAVDLPLEGEVARVEITIDGQRWSVPVLAR